MKNYMLTLEEVKDTIHDDDFVFVEIRKGIHKVMEDETFHLRAETVAFDGIDFSLPGMLMHCDFEGYNKVWRVWKGLPDWDNSEPWEG